MVDVVILLGGNLGDVSGRLAECRSLLSMRVGQIVSLSKEEQSEAWGFSSPHKFVNQAVVISTSLSPEELLEQTQQIEKEVGRDRKSEQEYKAQSGERYASRTIDIDIITYGCHTFQSERLTIPHPLMHEREFVLRPMVQVMPQWRHPILNSTTQELFKNITL